MSPVLEAMVRGMKRGAEIGTSPSADRLRDLSAAASSTDYTAAAWQSVGENLRAATETLGSTSQTKRG